MIEPKRKHSDIFDDKTIKSVHRKSNNFPSIYAIIKSGMTRTPLIHNNSIWSQNKHVN